MITPRVRRGVVPLSPCRSEKRRFAWVWLFAEGLRSVVVLPFYLLLRGGLGPPNPAGAFLGTTRRLRQHTVVISIRFNRLLRRSRLAISAAGQASQWLTAFPKNRPNAGSSTNNLPGRPMRTKFLLGLYPSIEYNPCHRHDFRLEMNPYTGDLYGKEWHRK